MACVGMFGAGAAPTGANHENAARLTPLETPLETPRLKVAAKFL